MTIKHTPGPWEAITYYIDTTDPEMSEYYVKGPESVDVHVKLYSEADAKLIAAAPDLLEALLHAQSTISQMGGNNPIINQAIDKATT